MKKLSWAIIGAGQIAGGFDSPDGGRILTHIKALKKSLYVDKDRISVVEPDNKKRKNFCRKWGVKKSYADIDELFNSKAPDGISVCTPPETHKEITKKACGAGVKVILCEKPLAASYRDALSIVRLCRRNGVKLIVNYPRRFDPVHLRAFNLVREGRLGRIQAVRGYYTKGLFNNGSHFINLLRAFFGKIAGAENLGGRLAEDFPYLSPDFLIRHRGVECAMTALDHRHYMLFELDIIGERGRLRLMEKGRQIKWYTIARDPIYRGYKALRLKKVFKGTFDRMISYAIDAAVKSYFGKNAFGNSMAAEAAEDIRLIEKIIKEKRKS